MGTVGYLVSPTVRVLNSISRDFDNARVNR